MTNKLWLDNQHTRLWVSVEYNPCRQVGQDVEVCTVDQAEFYSVYVRDAQGLSHCIADLASETNAAAMVALIQALAKSYVGEKPMNETIADVAYIAGTMNYYQDDSRADIAHFIDTARDFEVRNEGVEWGMDEGKDYIDAIHQFTYDRFTPSITGG